MKQKPEWIAKAHLNYEYFTYAAAASAFQKELKAIVGFPFNYRYEHLDGYYDQHDLERHVRQLIAHPQKIQQQILFIKKQIRTLLAASKRFGGKKSEQAFGAWYQVLRAHTTSFALVFGLEIALERMVRMFLDDWNFYKIAFARATATVKEQRSLLALASLPRSSARFKRNLARHVKEYSWTAHKLLTMNPFTEKSILERMRGIAKPEERLRALEESRRALERGYSQTVRKLARSQQKIVAQYREILYLRTERADAVGKSAALAKPLFEHIARKLGYTREELLRFSYLEIHAMLSGGKRLDPKPREKYYSWIVDGKLSVHWGSWGRPKPSQKRVEKLSGVVASKGIACGNVKIINDIPDLATFKRGNVLVARYTNPNMVVAMEQASAIVTDIGGMTSHAAIVSRELGVPCIINTKIATQVFKDGDRVEVDAEKGVVRKI